MKTFTIQEVAEHNSEGERSAWIVVNGLVYDVTAFANEHPGGKKILLKEAGKDATAKFKQFHADSVLTQYGPKLQVGKLVSAIAAVAKPQQVQEAILPAKTKFITGDNYLFGDLAAFCEPSWYQDFYSPYYTDSHRKFRAWIRSWVSQNIVPHGEEWEESAQRHGTYAPHSLWLEAGKAGILRMFCGLDCWGKRDLEKEFGAPPLPMGMRPGEIDYFHELILWDELTVPGVQGVIQGLSTGIAFTMSPILNYANKELQKRVVPELLWGRKRIALMITEPHAGSDVANLQATAKLSDDGKFWIVNGEKKWITNGVWADYFLGALRTGGAGMGGISCILVERVPGVTTRHVWTQGSPLAGTSYVAMEDAKVPVGNLMGELHNGFRIFMQNFNHERWVIVTQCCRGSRLVYQEALHYAHRRKTFGKYLIEHPVIRDKFGQMARQIESTQSWLEVITHQFNNMPKDVQPNRLGGVVALAKLQATRTLEFCAREASQIMGGISYTRGGTGGIVERTYREVRGMAIPGGSEEIMSDAGMRQALKASEGLGARLVPSGVKL
ncbi:hypothetical protein M427DRAFT_106591 [Gonapodya prolifera JEL478]|uniref:Cytochrome b5 heme-binding domain-containing protein n=1 Tax=Gonapodya prolifera (strain JEL478) TaxID=1344416 RepID=A0A139AZN5_GONPJ|nr:hypothetical protein M427DRAFT_106591 [Gonapodya prolifera JEL478]|eukprot:KXS22201.1 hypothetical protein M427DRAFT_106591 [Gonapodya prolifera JEL478]